MRELVERLILAILAAAICVGGCIGAFMIVMIFWFPDRTATGDTVGLGFWCGVYSAPVFFLTTLLLPLRAARRFAILGSAGWGVVCAIGLVCFFALVGSLVH